MNKILIIIPAYNEEANIQKVLDEINISGIKNDKDLFYYIDHAYKSNNTKLKTINQIGKQYMSELDRENLSERNIRIIKKIESVLLNGKLKRLLN